MSLFLKNLPKSFFRAIVSSRPIFNKGTSLFSSIAVNAKPSPAKLPILAVGRSHAKAICYGSPNEDRRKTFLKKYNLYDRRYSKKSKKSPKASATKSPSKGYTPKGRKPASGKDAKVSSGKDGKVSPGKDGKISSGAVTCAVNKGILECSIDCNKLPGGKKSKDEEDEAKDTEDCDNEEESTDKDAKKYIPKYKKEENESSRCDVKALTGTWVSKKCVKYDFAGGKKSVKDGSTKPVKIESKGQPSALYLQCKKASSKGSKGSVAAKSSKEKKADPCKKSEVEKKKSEQVEAECKEEAKKMEDVCEEEKVDQSPMAKCAEEGKKKKKKSAKGEKSCHQASSKPKSGKKDKGKKKPDDKTCKPCTSKKAKAKKEAKKQEEKKHAEGGVDTCGKKEAEVKKPEDECSDEKEKLEAANSALVVDTCDKKEESSEMDKKSMEIIAKLKQELADCRRSKAKEGQKKGECMPPPKLDAKLPPPKQQDKDVIGGSKNFIQSVCDGIFKNKKSPGKSKSAPVVKKTKKTETVAKSKSADCKIDLNPKHCEKTPKKEEKKKTKKKGGAKKDESKMEACKSGEVKKKAKEEKKEDECETSKQKEKPKPKAPCTYTEVKGKGKKDDSCMKSKKDKRPKAPCTYEEIKSTHKKDEGKTACPKVPPMKCAPLKKESVKSTGSKEKSTCGPKKKKSQSKVCSKEDAKAEEKKEEKSVCGPKTKKSETKVEKKKSLCGPKKKESKEVKEKEKSKDVCGPKKKKSDTKAECVTATEKLKNKADKINVKKAAPCGDDEGKKKESKGKLVEPCKAQDAEKAKDAEKCKESGPPDQSPLMQCIALCRKKNKANRPQVGKGIPPRDKKDCSKDPKVFKKLVEFDEKAKKCEEKKEGKGAKEEIKTFIPCKYEEIKPGIREVDECDDQGTIYKKFIPCSYEEVEARVGGDGDCEEHEVEKTVNRCEELEKKQPKESVQASGACPKFRNPCPDCQEEEKEEECEEQAKEDPCQEEKKKQKHDPCEMTEDKCHQKSKKDDSSKAAEQNPLCNVDKKNKEIVKQIEECKKEQSKGTSSSKLPVCTKQSTDLAGGNVGFFQSILNAIFGSKKAPEKSKSAQAIQKQKSSEGLKRSKSSDCKIDLNPKYCEKSHKEDKKMKGQKGEAEKKKEQKTISDPCKNRSRGYVRRLPPCKYEAIKRITGTKKEGCLEEKKKVAKIECRTDLKPKVCEKPEKKVKKEEVKRDECEDEGTHEEQELEDICKKTRGYVRPIPPCRYVAIKRKEKEQKKASCEELHLSKGKKEEKRRYPTLLPCPGEKEVEKKTKDPPKKKSLVTCTAKATEKKKGEGRYKKGSTLPPDQSPIMQCIALCKKKSKANKPQKGKVPPRDKKPCTEDPEVFKKLVEFDDCVKKLQQEEVEEHDPCEEIEQEVAKEEKDVCKKSKSSSTTPRVKTGRSLKKINVHKVTLKPIDCTKGPKKSKTRFETSCKYGGVKEEKKEEQAAEVCEEPEEMEMKEENKGQANEEICPEDEKIEKECASEKEKIEEQCDEIEEQPKDKECASEKETSEEQCDEMGDQAKDKMQAGSGCPKIKNPCPDLQENKKKENEKAEIKLFAPCQYENIKPGIRHPEEGETEECREQNEDTKKEDIKQFVPCRYEEIKPGIRHDGDTEKTESTEGKEMCFTVEDKCAKRSEELKVNSEEIDDQCIEDENTKHEEPIKQFAPCKYEEIKPGIRHDNLEREEKASYEEKEICQEHKEKPAKVERFGVKVDPCEKQKKSKEEKKTKKDSEKIKLFAPCQYEEIKPGIRDHGSGFGTKTKEVQGKKKKEDVKSRRGKSEAKEMKEGVSVGGSCPKIKNPCPDLQQKKEEEDECEENEEGGKDEIKTFVPCKYEEIKPGIRRQENSDDLHGKNEEGECEESENEIKTFVPCKYEDIKPGIRKPAESENFEDCEDSSDTIKQFVPCKYEEIKPGIRHEYGDLEMKGKKEHTSKLLEEIAQNVRYKLRDRRSEDDEHGVVICPKIKNPCPDLNEEECEESQEEIKTFVPCQYEEIKPGIRKPGETEQRKEENKANDLCKTDKTKASGHKETDNKDKKKKIKENCSTIEDYCIKMRADMCKGTKGDKKESKKVKEQSEKKVECKSKTKDETKDDKSKKCNKKDEKKENKQAKPDNLSKNNCKSETSNQTKSDSGSEDRNAYLSRAKSSALIVNIYSEQNFCGIDRRTMEVIEQLKRDIAECKRSISRGLRTMSECIQSPKLDASLPKIQEQQKGLLSGSVSFFRSVFNAVFPAKTMPKQSRSTHEMKKEKSKEILKRSKSSDCEIILKPKYGETSPKEEKRQTSGEKICKNEESKGVKASQKKQPKGYAKSSSPREYTEIKRRTDAQKEKESSAYAQIFMRAAREQKKSSVCSSGTMKSEKAKTKEKKMYTLVTCSTKKSMHQLGETCKKKEIKRSKDADQKKESSACSEMFLRAAREQKKSSLCSSGKTRSEKAITKEKKVYTLVTCSKKNSTQHLAENCKKEETKRSTNVQQKKETSACSEIFLRAAREQKKSSVCSSGKKKSEDAKIEEKKIYTLVTCSKKKATQQLAETCKKENLEKKKSKSKSAGPADQSPIMDCLVRCKQSKDRDKSSPKKQENVKPEKQNEDDRCRKSKSAPTMPKVTTGKLVKKSKSLDCKFELNPKHCEKPDQKKKEKKAKSKEKELKCTKEVKKREMQQPAKKQDPCSRDESKSKSMKSQKKDEQDSKCSKLPKSVKDEARTKSKSAATCVNQRVEKKQISSKAGKKCETKTAAPSKSEKNKSGTRHCEEKVKKTGKSKSLPTMPKVTTGKTAKKSKSLDCQTDLKAKHCEKSEKKDTSKHEEAKKTESEKIERPKQKKPCRACTSRTRQEGKPKLKKAQKKTLSPQDVEKEVKKTHKSLVTCSKDKLKTEESKKKKGPCKEQDGEKKKKIETKESAPPDQSPIMQCIALCRLKQLASKPQKGKGVPPRDKKPYLKDANVKKLVEFYETKNQKCEKETPSTRLSAPCKYEEIKVTKSAKEECVEDASTHKEEEECEEEFHDSKDDIKMFVPCKYENIKPGIRHPDDEECEERKEEIKQFVPCRYEEIKPGIRKPADEDKCEEQNESIKMFAPCMYEQIKPGIRHPEDVSTTEESKERKEEIKEFVPCRYEEIKPGLRHPDRGEEICEDGKAADKGEDIKQFVPCRYEEIKPGIRDLSSDKGEKAKNKAEEIKQFVPCRYEEIKPGIRGTSSDKEEKSTKKEEEIKQFAPCRYEEIKSAIRGLLEGDKKKSEEIKQFAPCRYEEIKSAIRGVSEGGKKKSEEIKQFVPCRYEEIKSAIRGVSDGDKKKSEEIKQFVPCRYEEIKSAIRSVSEGEKKKSEEIKQFVPCRYEEIKSAIRSVSDGDTKKSEEIKQFVPCRYEEIKPGIRHDGGEIEKSVKKDRTSNLLEEISKNVRYKLTDKRHESGIPCPKIKNPCPDLQKDEEECEESGEEIKIFVPCMYEEIKPGIRKHIEESKKEECEEASNTIKQFVPCKFEEIKSSIRNEEAQANKQTKDASFKMKTEAKEKEKQASEIEDYCVKVRADLCKGTKNKKEETSDRNKKIQEAIKKCSPCQHEEIKSATRGQSGDHEMKKVKLAKSKNDKDDCKPKEEKEPAWKRERFGVRVDPCKKKKEENKTVKHDELWRIIKEKCSTKSKKSKDAGKSEQTATKNIEKTKGSKKVPTGQKKEEIQIRAACPKIKNLCLLVTKQHDKLKDSEKKHEETEEKCKEKVVKEESKKKLSDSKKQDQGQKSCSKIEDYCVSKSKEARSKARSDDSAKNEKNKCDEVTKKQGEISVQGSAACPKIKNPCPSSKDNLHKKEEECEEKKDEEECNEENHLEMKEEKAKDPCSKIEDFCVKNSKEARNNTKSVDKKEAEKKLKEDKAKDPCSKIEDFCVRNSKGARDQTKSTEVPDPCKKLKEKDSSDSKKEHNAKDPCSRIEDFCVKSSKEARNKTKSGEKEESEKQIKTKCEEKKNNLKNDEKKEIEKTEKQECKAKSFERFGVKEDPCKKVRDKNSTSSKKQDKAKNPCSKIEDYCVKKSREVRDKTNKESKTKCDELTEKQGKSGVQASKTCPKINNPCQSLSAKSSKNDECNEEENKNENPCAMSEEDRCLKKGADKSKSKDGK